MSHFKDFLVLWLTKQKKCNVCNFLITLTPTYIDNLLNK